MIVMDLCKHKFNTLKKIFKDRHTWFTIERCRKCNLHTQTSWSIVFENGKMNTQCVRSVINIVDMVD